MKILFAAAEASPLVKIGGLADVIGSLPRAMNRLGHDVRTVIPAYTCLSTSNKSPQDIMAFNVHLADRTEYLVLQELRLDADHHVYLIRDSGLLSGPHVYTENDLERFFLFSRAVFELLPQLTWQPEVVHCHDWHTALVPAWLKLSGMSYASVFTIHNLAYQGNASWEFLLAHGLTELWRDLPQELHHLPLNFMAQGILRSDAITTVSKTYAREIIKPEFGMGLDAVLRYRQADLEGIVNGIDTDEFDPAADPYLTVRYDKDHPEGKLANKSLLQQRLNLPQNAEIPVIGMVSRLDEQKGFDIIIPALEQLLQRNVQLVVLGQGKEYYENILRQTAARYPRQIAVHIGFAPDLASLVYAGGDILLMPSKFEPCGLTQMIAMRYGTVPLVRRTGGLADTVADVNAELTDGYGFVFDDYTCDDMLSAIDRALTAYRNKDAWQRLIRRIMALDFSWQTPAREYEAVYAKVIGMKANVCK